MKCFLYLICFLIVVSFNNCTISSNAKIDTIALVTPKSYFGDIVIFAGQDTMVGDVKFIGGKHYFYVKNDGVFLMKETVSNAYIEHYIEVNGKLIKVYYNSPMRINKTNDIGFQVVGGTYGTYNTESVGGSRGMIDCVSFKSGLVSDLKGDWRVSQATICSLYLSKLKEIGLAN